MQGTHAGQAEDQFEACTDAIKAVSRRLKLAISTSKVPYGSIADVLSVDPDDDQLLNVQQACEKDLNSTLKDASLTSATNKVETLRTQLTAEFNKIDTKAAAKQARDDMAFTRRTLNTLFNDVNIYSISPVFVFDMARIGPRNGAFAGMRYGPGAGIRFELATTAHFTFGYAWNVNQGPGEGRGNIFFAIGVRDLFH